jgi:hypothetical protein
MLHHSEAKRHRAGLSIVHVVSESGIGAGIDSYYEYLLKAYILLGDDTYLERFNKVSISHSQQS